MGKSDVAFDVPSIGVDPLASVFKFVAAWPEHLCDDVRAFPRCGELVASLVALD